MVEYQLVIKQLHPQTPDSFWYSVSCYTKDGFFAADYGDTKKEAMGGLILYLLKTEEQFTIGEVIDTTRKSTLSGVQQ